jgi:hypothetical protein
LLQIISLNKMRRAMKLPPLGSEENRDAEGNLLVFDSSPLKPAGAEALTSASADSLAGEKDGTLRGKAVAAPIAETVTELVSDKAAEPAAEIRAAEPNMV